MEFTDGLAMEYVKIFVASDLDREHERGTSWKKNRRIRVFGKKCPGWRTKLGSYQCVSVI